MSASEQSDPTLPGTPVPPTPRNPYSFLSPAQRPDELGRLGDYRVLRLLGSGGMGLVFEAEQMSLRRRIALKVLKPELAADLEHRERFLREARAAASINSDHVVTIYFIADAVTPYLAMQFLEGESLQSRLEGPIRLTLRAALEIARQTAEGMAAAHEKGLTHRDIKPSNLWLEAKPTSGAGPPDAKKGVLRPQPTTTRVKILDFGLARRSAEPSLTSTGFIVGTPNYMSPEQASGVEVDGRADIFSLGCVLYTMLTGELPFPGQSAMAVMMSLANKTPTPVNEKNPTVPRGVAGLVAKMLEKDPARRPQTAREVVTAIEAILSGLPGNPVLPPQHAAMALSTQSGGGETPFSQKNAPAPVAPITTTPSRLMRRRSALAWIGLAAIITFAGILGYQAYRKNSSATEPDPIVVGILHSQSGTMAISENPVVDATLLAIEEINAAGGVLGRRLKPVIANGDSNPVIFKSEAERLLEEEKAVVIFGCWTSASRKAVRDLLQRRPDGLLFYPVQYEGLERSPRIVYLGPSPNQQLIPAVEFLTGSIANGGLARKRIYLVGSDYVYPRAAHAIIRDQIELKKALGIQVVGESFIKFGSDDTAKVVEDIRGKNADAIINTLNGSTNFHFFRELREKKIEPKEVVTLSVSIAENEIRGMNPAALAGNYLAASYFQSIDRPESREFLRRLRERFPNQVGSDPAAAAYSGVHLWAKAVAMAGTTDSTAVREACRGLEFDGPRARVKLDPVNLHAWLPVRIGRIRADGQVDLVPGAGSETPVQPEQFPNTRNETQWGQFLQELTSGWEGKWQPPDKN